MISQRPIFRRTPLWGLLCGLTLAVAQFFTGAGLGTAQAAPVCTTSGNVVTCTFSASGAPETWTVPAGVTSATFDLYGAQGGGSSTGGLGGRVTATLAVTPGASYQVRVGVWGDSTVLPAGYNGGGTGYGPGGGASDVRSGAFGLADRLLVAGGGGSGRNSGGAGGAGGYPSGGAGGADGSYSGGGGTQTAGGVGGVGQANGSAGTLGQGGAGGQLTGAAGSSGDGGGGGYYGGGGGGANRDGVGRGGGGGGGSSYAIPAATNVSFQNGVRSENGQVIISYTLADTTAPVANPTQSPAAAPSGWNNSNVTVTWNWSDPATSSGPVSGIDPANCTTSSVSSGSGTLTLTATCKDKAGNTGTATYQVKVDPTAPTANPSQSPAANGAGWNNTDVTVNWNWTFTGASIDTANCTTSRISSGEGTLTLSATCKDVALNQRTVPYTVKVDKTAPLVTVTGVSNGATYTLGTVPTAGCSTNDGVSGVATAATVSVTGGNPDGTGTFTATCSPATDLAGNSSAPTSVSYTVNALINNSVSQQSVSAVYNATPQNCPSTGGSLPLHAITPTLRNTTNATFSGLFFRVKTIEYTTAQSGQPVLCNATSGNGGIGSILTIPNSSLPGGNSQFNPGENLVPTFQIGLPVRIQYRLFVDLYAVGAAAATDDAAQEGEYLGSFAYTLDAPPASETTQLFLPLVTR